MTNMTSRPFIVVADDNRDAADTLAQLLRLLGYEATAVYDGRQAVAACSSHPAALAILDIHMPIMSGTEAAMNIRAQHGAALLLASLTSLRGRTAPSGPEWDVFDAHLSKPLQMSELSDLLARRLPLHD
jgi:CheY-like chemotaxis protein